MQFALIILVSDKSKEISHAEEKLCEVLLGLSNCYKVQSGLNPIHEIKEHGLEEVKPRRGKILFFLLANQQGIVAK